MKTFDERTSPPDWLAIEPFVESFESASRDGMPAPIDDHLPPSGHPLRTKALVELIRVDLELRRDRGDKRPLGEYRARYPEAFADSAAARELAFEEYRLRRLAGEPADRAEYAKQFAVDASDWPEVGPANSRKSDPTEPMPFPAVGETLCGFKLTKVLGQGAFGRVYLATQPELAGRQVAIKVSRRGSSESQRLARLQHAAIVPIHSLHRVGSWTAFVMPYFGSATLADAFARWREHAGVHRSGSLIGETVRRLSTQDVAPASSNPAPEVVAAPPSPVGWKDLESKRFVESALWIAAQLADGLAHAHARGVVHRDLKPANVLLSDDGQPMILDFHLAAVVSPDSASEREFAGGTFPYMAPEQIQELLGEQVDVDERVDIYALGAVLHEAIFGRPPHVAKTHGDWRDDARRWLDAKKRPWRDSDDVGDVSPATLAILDKCLRFNPAERYRSASELGIDLRRQIDDLPLVHAREPLTFERFAKWRRRNPRLSSGAFVGAVALTAIGLLLAILSGVWNRLQSREAEAAFRESQVDLRTAFFALPGLRSQPERDRAAIEACERLNRRYEMLEGKPAWNRKSVTALSPARRDELRARVGEMLTLWQRSLALGVSREPDEARRAELTAQALRLNQAAAACFDDDNRPGRLTVWRRALESGEPRAGLSTEPPKNVFDLLLSALDEIDAGRLAAAAERLEQATAAEPRHQVAWPLLGHCRAQLGQPREAERATAVCVALWPDAAWPRVDRGWALKELGRLDEADEELTRALAIDPRSVEALATRGLARMAAGKLAEAGADFDAALAIAPKSARLRMLKADLAERTGNFDLAARERGAAFEATPDDDMCWAARGFHRIETGDAVGALADFDRALDLNPWSTVARQNKAHVLAEMLGKTQEAVDELTRLVEANPRDAVALRGRGVLYARLGRRTEAVADAHAALPLDDGPEAAWQIGGIYATTMEAEPTDRELALRLLTSALEKGYGLDLIEVDPELERIRQDEDFQRAVESARGRVKSAN